MKKSLKELHGEIKSLQGRPNKKDVLYFVCPLCTPPHGIMVSWMPPSMTMRGFIWNKTGDNINNISIFPSIDCTQGGRCKFHGWVKEGKVIYG